MSIITSFLYFILYSNARRQARTTSYKKVRLLWCLYTVIEQNISTNSTFSKKGIKYTDKKRNKSWSQMISAVDTSGLSPLTWKTGHPIILPTSLVYRDDLKDRVIITGKAILRDPLLKSPFQIDFALKCKRRFVNVCWLKVIFKTERKEIQNDD